MSSIAYGVRDVSRTVMMAIPLIMVAGVGVHFGLKPLPELTGIDGSTWWILLIAGAVVTAAYWGVVGAIQKVDLAREAAAALLTATVGTLFWFHPGFAPPEDASQEVILLYAGGVFLVLYAYLWLQGGSIAFQPLGASYKVTTNTIFSLVPFGGGLIAFVLHAVSFKVMSTFMIFTILMAMALSIYDAFVNGGLMSRMNRYVSEYHNTRGTT